MSQENNNGFLYFAVGALLVAVIGIGYMFMGGPSSENTDLAVIETSAGEESTTSQETFKFQIDDSGFEASQTEETSN